MSQPVVYSTDVASASAISSHQSSENSLLRQYMQMRGMSLHLCSPLSVEDHALQSMADASPAKWHLAHTTWFFETFLLSQYAENYPSYHPAFRNLFNSYYNAVGDRPLRSLRHVLSRPSLDEVHAYRIYVDEAMLHLLSQELPAEAVKLIELGINHEQQHQELIVTDVKNGLYANPLRPPYWLIERHREAASVPNQVRPLTWQGFPEGVHSIGFEGSGFAFDNEGPRHDVYLQPFRIASRLVTNGEYLEFMREGGYTKPALWLSDGWDAVNTNHWKAPLYWEQRDGEWWHYTMDGMVSLDQAEPVCHVSFYEADAFARWAGARLPNEFEWEIAARSCRVAGNLRRVRRAESATCSELGAHQSNVWRCMGVDFEPLCRLSRIQAGGRRSRRIQRQVYVQPDDPARRFVRYAAVAYSSHLPQLLSASRSLAVHGASVGQWRLANNSRFSTIRPTLSKCSRG